MWLIATACNHVVFLYINEVSHLQTGVSENSLIVVGFDSDETKCVVVEELMEPRALPIGHVVVGEHDVVTHA